MDKLKSVRNHDLLFSVITILSFIPIVFAEYQEFACNNKLGVDLVSYTSFVIVVQSVAIFNLVMTNSGLYDKISEWWIIKRFDRCSFGIYIIHMLWINVAIKLLHIDIVQYNNLILVPVGIAVVFILSWVSTEVMLKIPVLKKYL